MKNPLDAKFEVYTPEISFGAPQENKMIPRMNTVNIFFKLCYYNFKEVVNNDIALMAKINTFIYQYF